MLDTASPGTAPKIGLPMLMAFLAIYVVWGSTYFAIRVVVAVVPPFFAAGARFAIAGGLLYGWSRARGTPPLSRSEWHSVVMLSALLFLIGYGTLFWAEKVVPSGIASVLVATIPIWMALLEIFILKREPWRWSLLISIVLGLVGVGALSMESGSSHRATLLPCLALLGSSFSWSVGTVWSKALKLPESKGISSGAQMMVGGLMLLLSAFILREVPPIPHFSLRALSALAYLIVAGSILAFTAYVWLLGRLPATKVASYAYVNPLVALVLGHWLGNEALSARTWIAAALIIASVFLILKNRPALH